MLPFGKLELQYGTMLFQIIIFIVLLWFVKRFAMQPIMKILNSRQEYIQGQVSNGEEENRESARLVEEQKQILMEARLQAHEIMEETKKQQERDSSQRIMATQKLVTQMRKDVTADLEREIAKAKSDLLNQMGTLSALIASKITGKQLDVSDYQTIIEDFLKQSTKT